MANMLTARLQKLKQRERLQARSRSTGSDLRRIAQRREAFFVKRLSQELGVDVKRIIEETEDRFDQDRGRLQGKLDTHKQELRSFALRNRRRLEQAIKTYDRQGLIEAWQRLYPNHPNLRMKFAQDWDDPVVEPAGVPGIGSEYAAADSVFDPVLDAAGEPLPVPGHDGLCKQFRARVHACAGDHRFGHRTARTEQVLTFRHAPPPPEDSANMCVVNEIWVPMTITGYSYSSPSDAIFFTQSLAMSGGGAAEVRLSIHVEQDTDFRPLTFHVVDNAVIHSDYHRGGQWLFGGLGFNNGVLVDGPGPIDIEITEPYRQPMILHTADHGGGEVRVVVKLNCYADAEHRRAEAEIDLMSDGSGVIIHEVMLHVASYLTPPPR